MAEYIIRQFSRKKAGRNPRGVLLIYGPFIRGRANYMKLPGWTIVNIIVCAYRVTT